MDKQERKAKDPMQDFMKELCKDMKEETRRVQQMVKDGAIKPPPDKEVATYDIQEKANNNKL